VEKAKRIIYLAPSGHLNTDQPSTNLVSALADRGFQVELLGVENIHVQKAQFNHPNIHLTYYPRPERTLQEQRVSLTILFALWAIYRCLKINADVVIGAGLKGLFVAWLVAWIKRLPFIYMCLELYPSKEARSLVTRAAKWLERLVNPQAAFTIIQDHIRAKFLSEDNGVLLDRIVFLPNTPRGLAEIHPSHYLHERLSIDLQKKIILYAGSITFWARLLDLVKAAQAWPEDWICVIHVARPPFREDLKAYLDEMQHANVNQRVVFSLSPVSWEELGGLIASADAAIALYEKDSSENLFYLGLSSGKMGQYLKQGLPMIMNELPGIRQIFETYHSVEIVNDDLSNLMTAIRKIFTDNYQAYRAGSLKCFNEFLTFDKYIPEIVFRIQKEASGTGS